MPRAPCPTLGLELAQLDSTSLARLVDANLLEPFTDVEPLRSTDDAPLDVRARSWLHANCSYCHRPGGTGGGMMDLRFGTALTDMDACDVAASNSLGIADARRIAPGDPERSVVLQRIRTTDAERMPPLASFRVDDVGVTVVGAWIALLPGCE